MLSTNAQIFKQHLVLLFSCPVLLPFPCAMQRATAIACKTQNVLAVCMSCIHACTAGEGTSTTGHTAVLLGQGHHSWASERKQLNKGLARISKSNSKAGQSALQSHADMVMCSKLGHCLQCICHHQMLGVCV